MIIRDATEADVPGIAALQAESWRSTYRHVLSERYLQNDVHAERLAVWRQRLSKAPEKPMFVMIAQTGSALVGFACVFPEEHPLFGSFLDNLHVAPELTGRGIGRRLLSEAARRLVGSGSRQGLYLWVIEKNHGARRFYERAAAQLIDSAMRPMPDHGCALALRYYWSTPESLLL
jgi:ribosomal protein S18 acetylase RimI-like enzyme